MEDYSQQYLKYKRKYHELKAKLSQQTGGAPNPLGALPYATSSAPPLPPRSGTASPPLPPRSGAASPPLPPRSGLPTTNSTSTTTYTTLVYNPYIDPLTSYVFTPKYQPRVYYDYKPSDYLLDAVLSDLEDDEDFKPRRRSSKKTTKRRSKKTSKRKSKKGSKRRSRK